ncbi:MAG TPA: ATP-binding protein [Acidimicrobiales bacterium]|jgi:signal transduction histidine kinase/type II secretory pathway pseudopilin PulG|nr:ATP-binding protein [Acidimicrobiales bacterium]
MSKRRDQLIAVAAAVLVLVLAGSVVATVLSAERNGRAALEDLQVAQLQQLARVLDGAFGPALTSKAALTNPADNQPWKLTANDPTDKAGLDLLQRAQPTARTGYVLVDEGGVVTNGTLLTDPSVIGHRLTRPGLDGVLAGTPALLPVSSASLTTSLETIVIARPIRAVANGPVVGAILQESDVAPDSAFTTLIIAFRRAQTDEYSFLDSNGVVVTSTNPGSVGKQADAVLLDPGFGFHRHGSVVAASASIPSVGWRATFRQSTDEFEGDLTGPLRSALLLIMGVAIVGSGLTFFVLLSRLRAARREQRRLADISVAREEFISIVSHELRTPATGQLGFLQTLLDHWDAMNDAERRQTVAQAFANARRLHALSRDVLDTGSIESGELPYAFQVIGLDAAAQAAVDGVLSRDHEIVLMHSDVELPVRADPERIQQVLANMLDNAMKNSPVGSRIDVRVATDQDNALVEVSDRGLGLTEDEIGRLFEKFSRGRHATVTGTGLGLYICRKILDAHGGRIWAERRDGGGATVAFALPLVADAEPAPAASGD